MERVEFTEGFADLLEVCLPWTTRRPIGSSEITQSTKDKNLTTDGEVLASDSIFLGWDVERLVEVAGRLSNPLHPAYKLVNGVQSRESKRRGRKSNSPRRPSATKSGARQLASLAVSTPPALVAPKHPTSVSDDGGLDDRDVLPTRCRWSSMLSAATGTITSTVTNDTDATNGTVVDGLLLNNSKYGGCSVLELDPPTSASTS